MARIAVPTDPSDEIIPVDGRSHLFPGEVAHVARNVVSTAVEPLYQDMAMMRAGWERIFGQGDESGLPPEMRSKGILVEMKDNFDNFANEQRQWKSADDAAKAKMVANQDSLIADVAQLRKDFEHEKETNHRMRWLVGFFIRWITTKDDHLSVALFKLAGLGTLLATAGVGVYHAGAFCLKYLWAHR